MSGRLSPAGKTGNQVAECVYWEMRKPKTITSPQLKEVEEETYSDGGCFTKHIAVIFRLYFKVIAKADEV